MFRVLNNLGRAGVQFTATQDSTVVESGFVNARTLLPRIPEAVEASEAELKALE